MPTHQIRSISIRRLRPNPGNVRTHSNKQIRQIANSIKQFGFTAPIIVDENNLILAGHGRWLAAKLLGLHEVPTARSMNWSSYSRTAVRHTATISSLDNMAVIVRTCGRMPASTASAKVASTIW